MNDMTKKEIRNKYKEELKEIRMSILKELLSIGVMLTIGTMVVDCSFDFQSLSKEQKSFVAVTLGLIFGVVIILKIKLVTIPTIKNYKLVKEQIADDMKVINPNDEENKVKKIGEM